MEIPEIGNVTVQDVQALADTKAKLSAAIVEAKARLRAVATELDARAQAVELKTELDRLGGRFDPQVLAAAGVPSAEKIGKAGA